MSLIFQSYAVWPHMTVFENVAYGLRVMKLSRSEVEDRTREVLQSVRMTDLAQRYPSELSGGQQQRVALARAVVVKPETLLLDEPLSNLDANLREEMRFEIRRIHDTTGITMVYVTHDQTEAMVAADRIALMRGGQDRAGRHRARDLRETGQRRSSRPSSAARTRSPRRLSSRTWSNAAARACACATTSTPRRAAR